MTDDDLDQGVEGGTLAMKIGVDCPSCQSSFEVAQEHAGKRGRCPRCREVFRVPEAQSTPLPIVTKAIPLASPKRIDDDEEDSSGTYDLDGAPTAGASARMAAARAATSVARKVEVAPTRPTREPVQILAAFRGEIEPVRPTLMYRLWIILIAFFMVLLPAIYLGLIALVGYAVYLHAITNHVIIGSARGKAAQVAFLLYLGPIIAGTIVVAFMLKPLFARAGGQSKVREIDPSKEPLLAAFIDGVCSSVGSPTPSTIEVDCNVNAGARRASWVLSPSSELVLTIGLPLVAGLTLRQFTGVLAHEFGHFSQGAGMRLSILIRSINLWFARVVYQRDEWDETLDSWATSDNHGAVMLLAWLVKLSVWLTRRVLWLLMIVAHAVSGFLSRQMEFDADRYEARMVGSDVFAQTAARLRELNLGMSAAQNELRSSWRERRLPDDLPRLVLVETSKIPEPLRELLRVTAEYGKTGLFDTHPCDRERVARALDEDTDGIFHLEGPATDLFRDFDGLARVTTFDYYRSLLGREVTRDQLYPITEALLNQEVQREGTEAFNRYFLEALGPIQALPLPPNYPKPPADLKAAKREIVEARMAMLDALEENRELVKTWNELHDRQIKAEAAAILLRVGKSIKAADYGLSKSKLPVAEAALEEMAREIEAVEVDLRRFAEAATTRLKTALALLEIDAVAQRVPEGTIRREETRALYASATTLASRIVPEMDKLHRVMQASGMIGSIFQSGKNNQDQGYINALLRAGQSIHEALTELKWKIGDAIPYPFEHAQDRMTLGRYALPVVPDAKAIGDLFQAGGEVQERIFPLHHRVLGRLTATAEAVEKAIGLQPLKAPRPEAEA